MDRDGRQGWSRRSEAAWERVFGPKLATAQYIPELKRRPREEQAQSFREKSAREA